MTSLAAFNAELERKVFIVLSINLVANREDNPQTRKQHNRRHRYEALLSTAANIVGTSSGELEDRIREIDPQSARDVEPLLRELFDTHLAQKVQLRWRR